MTESRRHEPALRAEGLTRRFGSLTAVAGVTFEIEEGEIVGLLGPNGAGKTTTMKMLTGILPPTGGSCSVMGFDPVEEATAAKTLLGYLPEQPPLHLEMTVERYLRFCAALRGLEGPEAHEHVYHAAALAGITHILHRIIGRLSKGYRQRVGLAQALVHEPPILVLDEPSSGLDPLQSAEVRKTIAGMRGTRTVLLSTHILPEASELCDRIMIIAHGRLLASGTEEELERRLGGPGKVRIVLRSQADLETLAELLERTGGVRYERPERENCILLEFDGKDEEPLRQAWRLLDSCGLRPVEIHEVRRTLEEIFTELTLQHEERRREEGR